MPRFSPLQRQRIRELLLDRAVQLFAERGYGAVTVEDVTGAAGIAKGTFYRFFDGKEQLFTAAVEREHERFHRHVHSFFQGLDVRDRERVRNILHTVVRELYAHPLLMRVLNERDTPVWLEVRSDPGATMAREHANTEFLAWLIAEGQRAGVMREGDPQELAGVIGQLLAGLLIASADPAPQVLRRLELALDLLLDGLYTRGRGEESC